MTRSATPPPARLGAIVLDCPDPRRLGKFYAAMLGQSVHADSNDEWVELEGGGPVLAFQRVANHRPPAWPDGAPQQAHVDLRVADFTTAHRQAVFLGATPLDPPTPPPSQGERAFLPDTRSASAATEVSELSGCGPGSGQPA